MLYCRKCTNHMTTSFSKLIQGVSSLFVHNLSNLQSLMDTCQQLGKRNEIFNALAEMLC